MQTPKTRISSSAAPQKISPRAVRQLKTTALEIDPASSSNQASRTPKDRSPKASRTPKERSPKVIERRSPRSPVFEKKRPSRISELESQISQLQEDLKTGKDNLSSAESWKRQAEQDAGESKMQLSAMSSKLEESQKQLLELSTSEEAHIIELQKISQDQDQAWQSKLEAIQKQHSVDSAALASAMNEIQQLRIQLDMVAESESGQTKDPESAHAELQSLKENLAETLSQVESMKIQLKDCKESEAQAQALVAETLMQLETAKKTVESLSSDGIKGPEAYNAIASELDQSRAQVNSLEGLVSKLKADIVQSGSKYSQNSASDHQLDWETAENEKTEKSIQLEEELSALKAEVCQLKTALETAERRFHEEQIQSIVQIGSANELVEQVKSLSSLKEAELEAELTKTKADIEEMKANLMDKETQLQGILEENDEINMKLEKSLSRQREHELEKELKKLNEHVEDLKANLMDKETELQNISEENEMLKFEVKKREMKGEKVNEEVVAEVEARRAAEQEALVKLGHATEEINKSNRRAAQAAEQLEAAQAANSEIEAELRRVKVQSDQWRKAAEAAAAMLSTANNGKFIERTGSLDSNYDPITGKISSPYSEDLEDDLPKKRNGNMLKKIGVLWKKPQK
ncbi:interactor of constitutive active ROPs 3 isoform X2 [Cornus florida]|uniref:interactor of constitutive active ROPs 3 isoform X2 n=1 Tax=Cornus florida TaxID=4283 RepID=UPI0028988B5C|nr:interactor of constitutive active ROPs 3 isoform X2 [Cornus florida]